MSQRTSEPDHLQVQIQTLPAVGSKAKVAEKRKRKLVYSWAQQNEVSALIAAVEKRPALWDGGCSDYKLANIKNDCWQQVAEELCISGVDAYEARNKWNVVRSLFKANLGKLRTKKSGQSSSEIVNVTWIHFSEMLFIESAEVTQSSESTSTMTLEDAYTDESFLRDVSQVTNAPNPIPTAPVPKPIIAATAPKRKKNAHTSDTTTETPAPSNSSGSMRDLAAGVLTSLQARAQGDRLSSFGELVASNLRTLPTNELLQLEGRIMVMIYDYLGSRSVDDDSSNFTVEIPHTDIQPVENDIDPLTY